MTIDQSERGANAADGKGARPAAPGDGLDSAPILPTERLLALEAELASIHAAISSASLPPRQDGAAGLGGNGAALRHDAPQPGATDASAASPESLRALNGELVALNTRMDTTIQHQRIMADDLQNILYSTNIATIFLDLDGRIRFFTPATNALFKIRPGDIGRPLADLAPLVPDPGLDCDMAAVREGSPPVEREIESAAGVCFCRRVLPYRSHDQQIEGVIITYTDNTERKRASVSLQEAREAADAANLAKSRFLASASHDLRQPLQALVLLQELLAQRITDPESRKLLGRVDRTLGAMAAMLDSLLDVNRIEAGAMEVSPDRCALDRLLDEAVKGLAPQAEASGLRLRWVPSGLTIVSDPRHLATMLHNLVANALKYTPRGGVLIGARRRGDQAVIQVWDTGIGIPPDKIDAVFQPYHQLGPAADGRNGLGLGLGLSIVRSLGDLLGHKVTLRSRVGKGSTFCITVPLAPADPETAAAPASGPGLPPAVVATRRYPPEPGRILIIDDDAELLELLGLMLDEGGHAVIAAHDEMEAMAALLPTPPDLIISDFRLANGHDGLDLSQRLRNRIREMNGRTVPVIILTGDISIDTLARFASNDVVRLSKPIRPAGLRVTIESLLGSSAAPAGSVAAEDAEQGLVHVIDDDPMLLNELGLLLTGAGLPVRLHGSAEAFRDNWDYERAGCLLIDVRLPGESGMDLMKSLKEAGTLPPAILITGRGDIGTAVAAMREGAMDFIEKPVSGMQIVDSIRRALSSNEGRSTADAERAAALGRLAKLTARQRQVMTMVLEGHPSKNIAADLQLSQRTVENHRAEIMRRSGCRSLPELARLVMFADPGTMAVR